MLEIVRPGDSVGPVPQDQQPLWRQALGEQLRILRQERGERLSDTAERAGISPQYLSEVERGRKEPSSEMIAAIGGALGLTLVDLTLAVAESLVVRETDLPAPGSGVALALAA
jgi:transcriptional regulator with XRE-family HTH domain